MERKKTQLETKIEERGFKLIYKTYKGKKSQFVEFYVYKGNVNNFFVYIYLDYKRERVDHYEIENGLPNRLTRTNLDELEKVYNEMFDMLYQGVEVVELAEIINDSED